MLKRLMILVLLSIGLACGTWPQVPRAGNQQEKHTNKQEDNTKSVQPSTIAIQEQKGISNQEQRSKQKPSQYPWHELIAPANMPNWTLAVLAGVAGWLAYKTLRAIKRQADIQAAGMKQWVAVDVISSSCTNIGSNELDRIRNEADKVNIWFSASNETLYPLTIQEIVVETTVSGSEGSKGKVKIEEIRILSPGKGREVVIGQKNIHDYYRQLQAEFRFIVDINLDQLRVEEYIARELLVSVNGYVRFQSAIGEIEKQVFKYMVSCGPGSAHALSVGSELKKAKEVGT